MTQLLSMFRHWGPVVGMVRRAMGEGGGVGHREGSDGLARAGDGVAGRAAAELGGRDFFRSRTFVRTTGRSRLALDMVWEARSSNVLAITFLPFPHCVVVPPVATGTAAFVIE